VPQLWQIQLIKVKEFKYEGCDGYIAGKKSLLVSQTAEKKSYRHTLLGMKLFIDE
jgi:hypothetical protein